MAFLEKFFRDPARYDEREQILRHVEALLNTERGFGSYLADIGHDDLALAQGDGGLSKDFLDELERTITAYEPRLKVRVFEEAEGSTRRAPVVRLECEIREDRRALYVVFDRQLKGVHIKEEA